MTSDTGRLLAGRFALDSRIGAGNYAEVFRATDTETGERVAVKTLRPEHASEEPTILLFEMEGKAGSDIAHPNVVKILSHGECDGTHFIVMELVTGISLRRRLKLAGPLEISESLDIGIGVLRGLEAIHEAGYIHRDIKPQNILIDANGIPKITDFGIIQCPGESSHCSNGLALGTAAYIAPEQATGRQVGPQADLYSAGAVLFEMLTGEAPFPSNDPIEVMNRHLFEPPRDPRSLNSKVSPALAAVVLRSLSKDPAMRFMSAQRMREALEMLQEAADPRDRRRWMPPHDKIAWTVPVTNSRPAPARLAEMPPLTTFVSALLLMVLVIVLILALVSSAVDASSLQSRISSSSTPSSDVNSSTPYDDPHQMPASTNVLTGAIPNWSVSAELADPIQTPVVERQTALKATPSATQTQAPKQASIVADIASKFQSLIRQFQSKLPLIFGTGAQHSVDRTTTTPSADNQAVTPSSGGSPSDSSVQPSSSNSSNGRAKQSNGRGHSTTVPTEKKGHGNGGGIKHHHD